MVSELEAALLQKMNYHSPEEKSCGKCINYVPCDTSGNPRAKNEHCTLNPAVELPVVRDGCCDHFSRKVTRLTGIKGPD